MFTIDYDSYVNSLSTRGFNLGLGIEILTIDNFQTVFGFFETVPSIDTTCMQFISYQGFHKLFTYGSPDKGREFDKMRDKA